MYMNKLALSRDPDRGKRPCPFLPVPTSTPSLPGEHWTLSFSTSTVPDDNGFFGTIFLHDKVSTYLTIQSAQRCSTDSLITCIDRLYAYNHVPDSLTHIDLNIKTITLDQSWFSNDSVSLSSPSLLAHAASRGYTLLQRPDIYPSIAPGLPDIADAARSDDDLSVLYLITTAYELRELRAPWASYDFLVAARYSHNSNPFPTIHGPKSRHHIFHGEPMPILASSCMTCGKNHRFRAPSNPWPQISHLLAYFPHLARLAQPAPAPF